MKARGRNRQRESTRQGARERENAKARARERMNARARERENERVRERENQSPRERGRAQVRSSIRVSRGPCTVTAQRREAAAATSHKLLGSAVSDAVNLSQ